MLRFRQNVDIPELGRKKENIRDIDSTLIYTHLCEVLKARLCCCSWVFRNVNCVDLCVLSGVVSTVIQMTATVVVLFCIVSFLGTNPEDRQSYFTLASLISFCRMVFFSQVR